jgi:hypothetical protein
MRNMYGPYIQPYFNRTIGGQLQAGLRITNLYEDGYGGGVFDKYMQSYIVTRAVKE